MIHGQYLGLIVIDRSRVLLDIAGVINAAGQFAKVEVQPLGIPLVIELFGADGRAQVKTDSGIERETLRLVADNSGDYRLTIRAAEKEVSAGRYKVTLVEIRPAVQRDRDSVAADRLINEGVQLAAQNTKEAQQAALRKYEKALALYPKDAQLWDDFTVAQESTPAGANWISENGNLQSWRYSTLSQITAVAPCLIAPAASEGNAPSTLASGA